MTVFKTETEVHQVLKDSTYDLPVTFKAIKEAMKYDEILKEISGYLSPNG